MSLPERLDGGRRLYEVYCTRLAGAWENHRYRGKIPVAWQFLSAAEREAWQWAVDTFLKDQGE